MVFLVIKHLHIFDLINTYTYLESVMIMSVFTMKALDGSAIEGPSDENGNPVLQINRLNELISYLRDHPETHGQESWADLSPECGTTMCAAGHAAVTFGGLRFRSERDVAAGLNHDARGYVIVTTNRSIWKTTREDADARLRILVTNGENTYTIPEVAEKYLGLTPMEGRALFIWSSDFNELEEAAEDIKNGMYR